MIPARIIAYEASMSMHRIEGPFLLLPLKMSYAILVLASGISSSIMRQFKPLTK